MLKDGAKHYQGLDEAVFRNIEACSQLSHTVRSAYGPNGMNKMVINHLEKLFVTNDAATIIKELEIQHPAARMVVLASQMQEQEVGDGTNFVIMFAGALMEHAEELIRMGLTPVEVCEGYEMALNKALEILPSLTCHEIKDYRNEMEVTKAIRSAIMSKQFGREDYLAPLIAKACISIMPEKSAFNVDNIRVCKILGGGIQNSEVYNGLVFKRIVEGDVTKAESAKVAVFTCPVDTMQTETKGTVLIKNAEELQKYSRGEECLLESQIKAIADAGAKVIVSGGKFGDMALHYCNKYELMTVRLMSKFDVRRVCRVVGAVALPRLTAPTPEEMGYCDKVYVDEIGDTAVVVLKQENKDSRISTVVIRGSTDNLMDDVERAVDDAVNNYKALTKDGRLVPGAGAVEIELAKQITTYGEGLPGLEQYAVKKFAEALEAFPKALAENSGAKSTEIISQLYAAHQEGQKSACFDVEDGGNIKDALQSGIYDLFLTKFWALKFSSNAACTVLKVDQIIMAKAAGGPKVPSGPRPDEED